MARPISRRQVHYVIAESYGRFDERRWSRECNGRVDDANRHCCVNTRAKKIPCDHARANGRASRCVTHTMCPTAMLSRGLSFSCVRAEKEKFMLVNKLGYFVGLQLIIIRRWSVALEWRGRFLVPGKTFCQSCKKKCSGEVLRVQDKYFHIGCFKCAQCNSSLAQGGFFARDGTYYCTKVSRRWTYIEHWLTR